MNILKMFSAAMGGAGTALCAAALLCGGGCATPDLKPFADASRTLASSINTGGDLAIKPLARTPLWIDDNWVQPEDPAHPYHGLNTSWGARRKAVDAVLVYSASLASIAEASARRSQTATELVNSVKELAAAVPSINVGANAAGDLMVFGMGVYIEVKAHHDLKKAVKAADPAVQLVARALTNDLAQLALMCEARQRDQLIQKMVSMRPVLRLHQGLVKGRSAQRETVSRTPTDAPAGAELARLDGLVAAAERDLSRMEADKRNLELALADAADFFATSTDVVEGWAAAHADLVRALEQRRAPNLALLIARAEELREIIVNLKNNQKRTNAP